MAGWYVLEMMGCHYYGGREGGREGWRVGQGRSWRRRVGMSSRYGGRDVIVGLRKDIKREGRNWRRRIGMSSTRGVWLLVSEATDKGTDG